MMSSNENKMYYLTGKKKAFKEAIELAFDDDTIITKNDVICLLMSRYLSTDKEIDELLEEENI